MEKQQELIRENKMGVVPVKKLLITMSLPMMISMLVQALYNVVDSLFVAQIGENALTAVSLAFPVQNLMIAIAVGTGVGINALLSRSLGQKDYKEANRAANNGVFLAVLSYLLFAVFGIFFTRIFFEMQTSDQEIIEFGCSYLSICTIASFAIFGQIVFERLLQSTGQTFYTMITQGVGAIVNIILDPILIFGLLGFPKMGVAGAAVATVLGQIAGMVLAILFNLKKNHEIQLKFRGFRPNGKTIARIYAVGVPSIIMTAIASVMTFGLNKILLMYSSTAAAVFGIYFKLQSFVFMPVFGLNNGMVPILSYNYGAQNKRRMIQTFRLSIFYATSIMVVGLVLFQIFPEPILRLFNASDTMMEIGVIALRVISLSFLFAGFGIMTSSVFQALGDGVLSMLVSIVRQLVVLLPAAYLLAKTIGLNAIWWSFPIAEVAAVIFCSLVLLHIYKKTIKPMPEGN